ncbi:MAG: GlxA family transcriptional regulator [Granulosicoccaceae bacterium]
MNGAVAQPVTRVGFFLVPDFTFMSLSVALDTLRAANRTGEEALYEWYLISSDGAPVCSSAGVELNVDRSTANVPGLDVLYVCGGENVQRSASNLTLGWLRKMSERKIIMGGICTGSYLLARAGLLNGYRCTIHWENMASVREEFPALVLSASVYEIDRDRHTCAGGVAPLDMMLHLVRERHGAALANSVSDLLICDRVRENQDRQRMPLKHRIGNSQPRLTEAVSLMEANIEEPMTLSELAHHIGLSRRQLERLFKKYLGCVPTRYYLELRLERARQLLLQTSMPVVDIALACGFISAPHFSKCYRDVYGLPPRDERRRAAGMSIAGAEEPGGLTE